MKKTNCLIVLALTTVGTIWAQATPPDLMNYQGVLRDASGTPLDGNIDMEFRFYGAETGGDEILEDRHTTADSVPVTVTNGLFSVLLGGGAVSDGGGPGTYTSLAKVFRDYGEVWLSVQVGLEVLEPRVRIASTGYALNAAALDGRDGSEFLDTSATPQGKSGRLGIGTSTPSVPLEILGGQDDYTAAVIRDDPEMGVSDVLVVEGRADDSYGVVSRAKSRAGSFHNTEYGSQAVLAHWDYGIEAFGPSGGVGVSAIGVGAAGIGIEAFGQKAGGTFNSVGVGTDSPTVELEVVGDARVTGTLEVSGGIDSVPPTWSHKFSCETPATCERFQLVMDGEAVLDGETGLVWEREPSTSTDSWDGARSPYGDSCFFRNTGGRLGWRLPSLIELATLFEAESVRILPPGHPFNLNIDSEVSYWVNTQNDGISGITGIIFDLDLDLNGDVYIREIQDSEGAARSWCVRGNGPQIEQVLPGFGTF